METINFSKSVNKLLFDYYERGATVPHLYRDEFGREHQHLSTPDVESVISSFNFLVSKEGTQLLCKQLSEGKDIQIDDIIFSYPANDFIIKPPHPDMIDTGEINNYHWPTSEMSSSMDSYVCKTKVVVKYEEVTLHPILGSDNMRQEVKSVYQEFEFLTFPCQVGSSRCNLAVLRSYLSDDRYREKVTNFLMSRKWEPYNPDGYFIVKGRLKRVAINDKLLMNIPYVVKPGGNSVKEIGLIRERICEVRSMKSDKGVYTHQVYFPNTHNIPAKKLKDNNMDKDVYRFLNAGLNLYINNVIKADKKNNVQNDNILQFIAFYVAIVLPDRDTSEEIDKFIDIIRMYSNNDSDIMMAIHITKSKVTDLNPSSLRSRAGELFNLPIGYKPGELRDIDIDFVRDKFLPHCEIYADPYENFQLKMRFLAMMVINVCLAVQIDPVTGERRLDNSDRKSFIYKRWETAGYLFKESIRQKFLTNYPTKDKLENTFNLYTEDRNDYLVDLMNENLLPNKQQKRVPMIRRKNGDYKNNLVADCLLGSPLSMLDSLLTVKISMNNGPNAAPARKIHATQFGYQCPANTPENSNIGLINGIAEAALITNELTVDQRSSLYQCVDELTEGKCLLIVDEVPLKYVSDESYDTLIQMRRDGRIHFGVSISKYYLWKTVFGEGLNVIRICISHGRPIQPMISLKNHTVSELMAMDLSSESIETLMQKGIIEFLDPSELSYNCFVAETLDTATEEHTHSLIKRSYVLSKTTNCLVFCENNTAQRGTLGSQHLKQAVGKLFLHNRERFDHDTNFLLKPELPLIMSDTMRRIYNPRYKVDADIGHGITVNVCCMPFNGNNDDGIHFSESFAKSKLFRGNYVSILKSEKYSTLAPKDHYNWLVNPLTSTVVMDSEERGIPDPDFSDSIILEYGRCFKIEARESNLNLSELKTQYGYELFPGEYYHPTGMKKVFKVSYDDGSWREVVLGRDIIETANPVTTIEVVDRLLIFSLYRISDDKIDDIGRETLEVYEEIVDSDRPIDKTFLVRDGELLKMGKVRIPRTLYGGQYYTEGEPYFIAGKRKVTRKDVGVRVISQSIDNSELIDVSDRDSDRFEATFGYIDNIKIIKSRSKVNIRVIMPIDVKPGNKYASFHAQKNVCAKIKPDYEMPRVEYLNPVTGETETMTFDIVFNSLSVPSRMTIGLLLEIQVVGTLKYIYEKVLGLNIHDRTQNPSYTPLTEEQWKMIESRGISRSEIEILTDATTFMYNNDGKIKLVESIRKRLGLPIDSKYNVEGVENPILCGSIYYGVLHHLVDNKSRAKGFTGKKDAVTGQMVKGKKLEGGTVTGTMEADGYKSHGAISMLYERMSVVTDQIIYNRCPYCSGLVALTRTPTYTLKVCNDCQRNIDDKDIIRHRGVKYTNLHQAYARAIGIDLKYEFE